MAGFPAPWGHPKMLAVLAPGDFDAQEQRSRPDSDRGHAGDLRLAAAAGGDHPLLQASPAAHDPRHDREARREGPADTTGAPRAPDVAESLRRRTAGRPRPGGAGHSARDLPARGERALVDRLHPGAHGSGAAHRVEVRDAREGLRLPPSLRSPMAPAAASTDAELILAIIDP